MRFIKLYFPKCEIDDPVIYLDSDFVRLKKISLSFIDLQELFNILQFFFSNSPFDYRRLPMDLPDYYQLKSDSFSFFTEFSVNTS